MCVHVLVRVLVLVCVCVCVHVNIHALCQRVAEALENLWERKGEEEDIIV